MSPTAAAIVVVLALACAAAWGLGALLGKRGERARDWVSMRTRHRRPTAPAEARPFEDVVAEVRRLGTRFHALGPHASYAKVEAVRAAYDRALAQCCATLGITHLLGVLPPGAPLDAERRRVEALLGEAGVRLPFAA
ncbi:hypothetical protein [Nocardioides flavescens]|uniref:Uncharacterized protein n=1 Tax=Nocardioides flavescens TaxID=2691959 RepID=A0A6L7F161_9ACTN|nr:hypothetical protein [Nocardioides flavescens]MXG90461.1 hypothetical protein [Nocardioides flavescens]